MRTVKIDLGMVITVEVPDDMSDYAACGEIFEAMGGKGDPRDGTNMNALVTYYVGQRLKENLENTGSKIQATGGMGGSVRVEGDTRTPRQRALDQ